METIVRIKEVLPISTVEYQSRETGKTEILHKKNYVVKEGDQSYMIEAQGRLAELLEQNQALGIGSLCLLTARIYTREFLTRDNQRGWATDIIIKSLSIL